MPTGRKKAPATIATAEEILGAALANYAAAHGWQLDPEGDMTIPATGGVTHSIPMQLLRIAS